METIKPTFKEIDDEIVVVFDLIISKKFRRFAPLIWTILGIIPIGIVLFLAKTVEDKREEFLLFSVSLSVGFHNVPWAFRYCYNQLAEWSKLYPNFILYAPSAAKKWYFEQLRFFRGTPIMFGTGLATTAVATTVYVWAGPIDTYPIQARLFCYTLLSLSAFVAGMGICAIFLGTMAIYRLGLLYQVRVDETNSGILSTGITLGKCYFAIAFTWSFYVLSGFSLGDSNHDIIFEVPLPVLFLAFPTFVLFLGAFIVCQIPLRRRMQEFKRLKIAEIEDALASIRPEKYKDLSLQVIAQIEFLEKERTKLAGFSGWPFSSKVFLGTLFSSIYLIWPVFLNAIFGVIFDETLKELIVKGLRSMGL